MIDSVDEHEELEHGTSDTDRSAVRAAPWSTPAVRLLQGVVYQDDNARVWDDLLRHASALADYFGKIGLQLVVDELDGMAYLRQNMDDSEETDGDEVPRLFRRTPLSYETTLLCVLLRDALRQFEDEDLQNDRCVLAQSDLFGLWRAFFSHQSDEVKLQRAMLASLRKLEELKFVRQFETNPPSWEVRPIIKARLPLSELEQLRVRLLAAVHGQASDPDSDNPING